MIAGRPRRMRGKKRRMWWWRMRVIGPGLSLSGHPCGRAREKTCAKKNGGCG